MITKLISYAYLRTECDISQNIPDQELDAKIRWAQDMLKMLLGKSFYDQIVSQFQAGTLTADNTALFDPYIKQFLAWQAHEDWLIKANFKDTRAGFRVHREDNSDPVSDANMAILIKAAKSKSSTYKNELIGFLNEEQARSSSKYPLYDPDCELKTSTGTRITSVSKRRNEHYKDNCCGC